MMESLVSLSILTLFISIVFPFSLDILAVREQVKTEVEMNRFLYESALFYKRDEPQNKTFTSGNTLAYSIETSSSIRIYSEEDKVSALTFISAQW